MPRKLCRQPSDFFHWRSHLQTLMRSERVVQFDGFLCEASDLLQTFVFCTEEPSVLERIVHPLGQSVVQWVSALCHAYLYLLLSAKLQNDTISLSATPINRRCGFLFRKVSPFSQRVKVRRVGYRGYPRSSTNLFRDVRRNYSSQCST